MSKEEFRAMLSSLARIELLIQVVMKERYGEKEAKRVYEEVSDLIEVELFKEVDND